MVVTIFVLAGGFAVYYYQSETALAECRAQLPETTEEYQLFCGNALGSYEGEKLFKIHCASCHKVDKKLVGPRLRGVFDRIPSSSYFDVYLRHQQLLLDAEDEYAKQLRNEYSKVEYVHSFNLSLEELKELRDYLAPGF